MISNPVNPFINGYETLPFEYEGGNKVYHFSPYDNNLSTYLDCNIILFANSEEHGLEILKAMFTHLIECKAKYIAHSTEKKSVHWEEFIQRAENDKVSYKKYLTAIIEGRVKLSEAPKNQVYKVGWSSNDNI